MARRLQKPPYLGNKKLGSGVARTWKLRFRYSRENKRAGSPPPECARRAWPSWARAWPGPSADPAQQMLPVGREAWLMPFWGASWEAKGCSGPAGLPATPLLWAWPRLPSHTWQLRLPEAPYGVGPRSPQPPGHAGLWRDPGPGCLPFCQDGVMSCSCGSLEARPGRSGGISPSLCLQLQLPLLLHLSLSLLCWGP